MSIGSMRFNIQIISREQIRDKDGFVTWQDVVRASVRAYREMRHASEAWTNRAVFSTAKYLFRFRKIPGLDITTAMFILSGNGRFNISSVEDVRGRGMYIEVLSDLVQGSA